MKFPLQDSEFVALLECSARLGRDPLMVQGSTGNTSIKAGDTLWIKASGQWLAKAADEPMFVPVDLSAAQYSMGHNIDPCLTAAGPLRASVETAMHCVIPSRVVIHVHSVNSIAWAVRRDGEEQLTRILDGIRWKWIPYVASGLALARAIEQTIFASPDTEAFILGNHGIVAAGPDCASAYATLMQIEKRVALPSRFQPDDECGRRLNPAQWLSQDSVSRNILSGGFLYPCHAVFLGEFDPANAAYAAHGNLPAETAAALSGLAEVVSRLTESAPVRYLTAEEVDELLAANVYHAGQLRNGDPLGHIT